MTNPAIGKDKERLWCILPDTNSFYMGAFKALIAKEDSGLLSCSRTSDNGRIKLSYDISGLKPLSEVLPSLSSEQLISIAKSMTSCVITVQNNPYLSLESTLLERENIFIREKSEGEYDVSLICLPILGRGVKDEKADVDRYCRFLHELIHEKGSQALKPELRGIDKALESGSLTLESLEKELGAIPLNGGSSISGNISKDPDNDIETGKKDSADTDSGGGNSRKPLSNRAIVALGIGGISVILSVVLWQYVNLICAAAVLCLGVVAVVILFTRPEKSEKKRRTREKRKPRSEKKESESSTVEHNYNNGSTEELFIPSIRLVGQNTPVVFKLVVDCPEYEIGRDKDQCNGVITFNNTVGRKHCKISTKDGRCYVTDHTSKNKTRINGKILEPEREYRIQINDTLQISDIRFKVEAE